METRKVVCAEWKYRRDDGCFSPYTPKTAAHLELARANGASSYWVDFVRTVHFEEMVQRNSRSEKEHEVQRTLVKLPASPSINAYWAWEESDDCFVPYPLTVSIYLERAYQQGWRNVDLWKTSFRLPYTVDFDAKGQIQQDFGTYRRIRQCRLSFSLQEFLQAAEEMDSERESSGSSPPPPLSPVLIPPPPLPLSPPPPSPPSSLFLPFGRFFRLPLPPPHAPLSPHRPPSSLVG